MNRMTPPAVSRRASSARGRRGERRVRYAGQASSSCVRGRGVAGTTMPSTRRLAQAKCRLVDPRAQLGAIDIDIVEARWGRRLVAKRGPTDGSAGSRPAPIGIFRAADGMAMFTDPAVKASCRSAAGGAVPGSPPRLDASGGTPRSSSDTPNDGCCSPSCPDRLVTFHGPRRVAVERQVGDFSAGRPAGGSMTFNNPATAVRAGQDPVQAPDHHAGVDAAASSWQPVGCCRLLGSPFLPISAMHLSRDVKRPPTASPDADAAVVSGVLKGARAVVWAPVRIVRTAGSARRHPVCWTSREAARVPAWRDALFGHSIQLNLQSARGRIRRDSGSIRMLDPGARTPARCAHRLVPGRTGR